MRFDGLDLNLLVALDILLTEKNITRAGEKLFLSQPATSAALARLRDYFEDDLLVQVGRSMVLTPMGENLAKPVSDLLIQMRTVLNNKNKFDPLKAKRKFTVMASDYTGNVLLPRLNQLLYSLSPQCSIEQLMPSSEAEKQIERGKVDILFLPSLSILDEHPSLDVFEDEFVCVMWNQNPLKEKPLTLEDYTQAEHVVVRLGAINKTPMIDDWLIRNLDIKRNVAYVATNFNSVPRFVVGTPYIAIMHKKLAVQCAEYLPIHLCPLPWEVPKIKICMQWNKFQENDAGLLWFRQLIMQVTKELDV
ncbi:LysR family transcriptional regulator [Acinetobacter sp. ANC 4173]|uniref:LysR family transcriptional regulator n=1 Tax=Acinetobacter sp. ANC 4173 TaxID=2529837 RepID=UPI00103D8046|nr:LysR family transcriptional regulator [Acinetobacter sp. ANC 4173]TCB73325.1 LysR family transcriptional regulator [Acinetobacter sp. ANC 4173]